MSPYGLLHYDAERFDAEWHDAEWRLAEAKELPVKLVECVPNFSEGRDRPTLDAIAAAIRGVEGVQLLDIDPGVATNRTVFTLVGRAESIVDAAFAAIATAAARIDMRQHRGEHARIGATDVCPFVPLAGASMEDCVALARQLGERVGRELDIPVYLYEEAATRPERRNLAHIRSGEYEGLADKLQRPEWKPDFGPARFNARSGATVIGARKFLVAYNINLNSRDKRLANDIALELREAGRNKRGPDGKFVRDANGVPLKEPGRFRSVKAVGWYIEEYGRAQISINFTDLDLAPVHAVFDAACEEAGRRGLRVTGSEIVGLIPQGAILAAGRHYLARQGRCTGVPESELIHIAVRSLGLDELSPFDPSAKIIEHRVRDAAKEKLQRLAVRDFVDVLSTDAPAPGGGSVAALCGALGAALTSMVANLTFRPVKKTVPLAALERLANQAQELKQSLLAAIDADTAAFEAVLAAARLPARTSEQQATRQRAGRDATRGAIEVPLRVLGQAREVAELAGEAARLGLAACLSDAGVAALCAATAAEAAYYNVLINLATLDHPDDAAFALSSRRTASQELDQALAKARATASAVRSQLEGAGSAGTAG